MNTKIITQHLKSKGFNIADDNKVKTLSKGVADVVAGINLTTSMIVSWVITDNPRIPHTVVIACENSNDIRFKGKIENLQQFNMVLKLVE